MKQIILIDVQSKKEFVKMLKEMDEEWKKQQKNIRRIMRNGF